MLSCHWFACLMYFSARVDHFSRNSWVGRNYYRCEGQPVGVWCEEGDEGGRGHWAAQSPVYAG